MVKPHYECLSGSCCRQSLSTREIVRIGLILIEEFHVVKCVIYENPNTGDTSVTFSRPGKHAFAAEHSCICMPQQATLADITLHDPSFNPHSTSDTDHWSSSQYPAYHWHWAHCQTLLTGAERDNSLDCHVFHSANQCDDVTWAWLW